MKQIITLLLLISTAHAETWIKYAHDDLNTQYEYEQSQITHHELEGKVFVVWNKSTHNQDSKITRLELHCGSRSYRKTYEIRRERNNLVYEQTRPDEYWSYAVPDGVEMRLIQEICSHYE